MTALAGTESVAARVSRRLAECVGPHRYNMWFDQSARLDFQAEPQRLEIAVPNQFVAEWIGRHFGGALRRVLTDEVGQHADLAVRVDPSRFRQLPPAPAAARPQPAAAAAPNPSAGLRHRLEDFVRGPSNDLAFAAARRLAEEDTPCHGPFFLHGGVGLGKTHLLQGVCSRLLQRRPEARVLYTTSEQFTNQFLGAIRGNSLDAFRRRIRQLDLLAVDDVHFIANKQATQQEFLHSLNAIELCGARIALASDSHPKLIAQFSQALISRCVRGLVVEVHPPDTETRLRIVRALAQRRGLSLMETVVATLASRCEGSVRELEGALTKLAALAALAGEGGSAGGNGESKAIGQVLAQRLWQSENPTRPKRATRLAAIVETVAARLQLDPQRLCHAGRQRQAVLGRSLVIFLARQLTRMSYPEIARELNLASHSTVIAAERRVQGQVGDHQQVTLGSSLEPVSIGDLLRSLRQELAA